MASFSVSPLQLTVEGQGATFIPARFGASPLVLAIAGQKASFSIIGDVAVPRIERLQRYENRVGGTVEISQREQIVQQRNAEGVENAFRQLNNNVAALQSTLNLALEGLAKATAIDDKIEVENSYPSPPSVGTAFSDGTVQIAAHSRIYTGTTARTVSVDGGTITGQASGTYVTVYYRDAARAGGAVAYVATTNAIAQTGDVHIVWQGTIPDAGEPASSGTSPTAPGYTLPPETSGPSGYE